MSTPNGNGGPRFGTIAVALLFAVIGYGLGRFQGSLATGAATEQLEEATRAKRVSQEAVASIEKRTERADAFRLVATALVSVNRGDPESAKRDLGAASHLLKKSPEGPYAELQKQLESLSGAANVASRKGDIESVLSGFDQATPRAISASGAGQ